MTKLEPGQYAASVDASWSNSGRGGRKIHVAVGHEYAPVAACSEKVQLNEDDTWELKDVPRLARCQRRGCKGYWA